MSFTNDSILSAPDICCFTIIILNTLYSTENNYSVMQYWTIPLDLYVSLTFFIVWCLNLFTSCRELLTATSWNWFKFTVWDHRICGNNPITTRHLLQSCLTYSNYGQQVCHEELASTNNCMRMNAMNLKVTTAVLGSISVKEHEMRIVIMNDTLCCAYACMLHGPIQLLLLLAFISFIMSNQSSNCFGTACQLLLIVSFYNILLRLSFFYLWWDQIYIWIFVFHTDIVMDQLNHFSILHKIMPQCCIHCHLCITVWNVFSSCFFF